MNEYKIKTHSSGHKTSCFFVWAIVSLCSLQYYFFLADIKFIHKLITELKAVWQENKKVWRYLFIRLFLKISPSFRGNSRTFRCSKLEKDKKRIEQLFIYFCFFYTLRCIIFIVSRLWWEAEWNYRGSVKCKNKSKKQLFWHIKEQKSAEKAQLWKKRSAIWGCIKRSTRLSRSD